MAWNKGANESSGNQFDLNDDPNDEGGGEESGGGQLHAAHAIHHGGGRFTVHSIHEDDAGKMSAKAHHTRPVSKKEAAAKISQLLDNAEDGGGAEGQADMPSQGRP